jgi:hypothetical protein
MKRNKMKNRILKVFLAVIIFTGFNFAQNTLMRFTEKETQSFDKPRPVHAGEYLQRFYERNGFNPDNYIPQTTSLKKLHSISSWALKFHGKLPTLYQMNIMMSLLLAGGGNALLYILLKMQFGEAV